MKNVGTEAGGQVPQPIRDGADAGAAYRSGPGPSRTGERRVEMEEYIPGHTAAYLRSKCDRCCPYLGFLADAGCSGDYRDHRDLRLAFSIPPGRQTPSNLIFM